MSRFNAFWSEEDSAWVGVCTHYEIVCWLASTKEEALRGIQCLVAEIEKDVD